MKKIGSLLFVWSCALQVSHLVWSVAGLSDSLSGFKSLPDLKSFGSFPFGSGKKEKKGICGDGVTDLTTEECDSGDKNGEPGNICTADCLLTEDAKCGDIVITSLEELEALQGCGSVGLLQFNLTEEVDVVLPNLLYATNDIKGLSGGVNLATSLDFPSLILADNLDFDDESSELLSLSARNLEKLGELELTDVPKLQSVHFPKVEVIDNDIELERLPELRKIDFSSLVWLEENLEIIDVPNIEAVEFPSLFGTADIRLKELPSLIEADFPSLFVSKGFELEVLPNLPKLRAPALTIATNDPVTGWDLLAPLGPSNSLQLVLCSLPAFDLSRAVEACEGSCTAVGGGSSECSTFFKEKGGDVKEKGGLGGLLGDGKFDLGGLSGFAGKEGDGKGSEGLFKLDLSSLGKGKDEEGGAKGKKEKCPASPFVGPSGKKKEPVCGNGIVEVGEMCDGDAAFCSDSCTFLETAVCDFTDVELDRFIVNSTDSFEALLGCVVILGDVKLEEGAPEIFELPVLQEWFGRILYDSDEPVSLRILSFPSAWRPPDVTFSSFEVQPGVRTFEFLDAPCGIVIRDSIQLSDAPNFRGVNLPKLQFIVDITIDDSCNSDQKFDLSLPDLISIEEIRFDTCPGITAIDLPSLQTQENKLILRDNLHVETVSAPRTDGFASSGIEATGNPKLSLIDRSSQQFFTADFIDEGFVIEGSVPEGVRVLLCSLNLFQVNQILDNGRCDPTATPPCFIESALSEACIGKKGGTSEGEKKLFEDLFPSLDFFKG
uniref:Uncharacterized protein n=1 Tax=Chromera velia CCMP2878 TaxID=1169474 RepID=A0A0G4HRJ1_9ALVE|eukprot:Cvel_1276.t1-p1 / transcript=Cvel_1276.t1 / gene=Cvel_1276 / organism=Chromera_velia_CCMP2878 / gene_product=hypothetical protein / transcript_product=hypothetical protein / location=Cvel_scaffold43:8651-12272(+) / protein_length=773 / sequence_SO=supercontig / SO=protein_coding / is_pseudo=false